MVIGVQLLPALIDLSQFRTAPVLPVNVIVPEFPQLQTDISEGDKVPPTVEGFTKIVPVAFV